MKVYISTGYDCFYGFNVLYDFVILLYFEIFIIMTVNFPGFNGFD